jgi:excisionase family DNA binding protein
MQESQGISFRGTGLEAELLTLPEVASLLRVSNATVCKLIRRSNLPAYKVANQWRFRPDHVEDWLETQSVFGPQVVMLR